MAKYCMKCGTKNKNDVSVCSCCGMSLDHKSIENPNPVLKKETPPKLVLRNDSNDKKTTSMGIDSFPNVTKETIEIDSDKLTQTNQLLKKGLIMEIQCQNDFIYILKDKSDFSATEYKVLNSIGNKGMLKCKKIKYNGNDALYYMTEQLKSFDIIFSALDTVRLLYVLENLLNQIHIVKGNGFLSDTGLDLRMNRIFVDATDGKVYLTYIPINQRCYPDMMYLENNLRSDLVYMIQTNTDFQKNDMMKIVEMLAEPACSLGNLLSVVRQTRARLTGK